MGALTLGDALAGGDGSAVSASLSVAEGALPVGEGAAFAALPIRARYRVPRRTMAFVVPSPTGGDPLWAVPVALGLPPWIGPQEASVPHAVDLSALTGRARVLPAAVAATATVLRPTGPADATAALIAACQVAPPGALVLLGTGAQQAGVSYVVALSVTLAGAPAPARTVLFSLRCLP